MAGQTVVVSVLADTRRFSSGFKGIAGSIGKLGVGIAAGLGVATAGLVKLGKAAVSSASDLQQTSGAVDAVFKKNATQVHKWAASAWKDLGLSTSAYSQASAKIGAQLKNMGVPTQQLAKQTNGLVKRGADLAAQFGGTTSEAVSALSALLRGETDPIERYGVSIKEIDIKAQMAADGTDKLTGAQAKAARTQAIMTLLAKQTGDAMGANAREAKTWEGVTQRLAGWWENLKAVLGGPIIAVLAGLVAKFTALADKMTKTSQFTAFLAWLNKMGDGLAASAGNAGGLIRQVIALVKGFSPLSILINTIRPILPQLATAFAAIATTVSGGLAAVLPKLTPLLDSLAGILGQLVVASLPPLVQIVGVFTGALAQLLPPLAALAGQLLGTLSPVLGQLTPLFATIAGVVGQVFTATLPPLIAIVGVLAGALTKILPPIAALAGQLLSALAPVLTRLAPLFATVASVVGQVLAAAVPIVTALVAALAQVFAALVPALMPIIDAVMEIAAALAPMVAALAQLLGAILPPLIGVLAQLAVALTGQVAPAIKTAAGFISGLVRVVAGVIGWFANLLSSALKATDGVNGGWAKVLAFLGTIHTKVGQVFAGVGKWLISAGADLLKGLWRGISDTIGWLKAQIGGAMDAVIRSVKATFGIHSPSKVFRQIGRELPRGLAIGVTDTTDHAVAALAKMATAITRAATKATRGAASAAKKILSAHQKTTASLWKAGEVAGARSIAAALATNGRWTAKASAQLRGSTLADIAKARGALTTEIKAQTGVLADLISQHAQLRDQIASSLSGALDLGATVATDATGRGYADWGQLRAQASSLAGQATALASKMKQLIAKGLPPALVQQIAGLGIEKGSAVADAFLAASSAEVKAYTADWSSFNTTTASIGKTLADQMYGAGISAQQGLLKGLTADQAKLVKAAEAIANTLTTTIKKKLGIKSPSTVFRGIAGNVIDGLRLVFSNTSGVESDMVRLADAVAGSFDPTLTMQATTNAGTAGAAREVTINVHLHGTVIDRQSIAALRDLFTTEGRIRGVLGATEAAMP